MFLTKLFVYFGFFFFFFYEARKIGWLNKLKCNVIFVILKVKASFRIIFDGF